jgi:glycosylphosphatidylinositol transamidase
VIVASWVSLQNDGANRQPNLRGVATVLALANSLRRQPVWAKDLIFLISDSYLDGAHAWLTSYHGATQNGWSFPMGLLNRGLNSNRPMGTTAVGPTAYWGHLDCSSYRLPRSFIQSPGFILWSVRYLSQYNRLVSTHTEGTNGRLPNQDLCNSASLISRGMGVPIVLHDDKDEYFYNIPKWLGDLGRTFGVGKTFIVLFIYSIIEYKLF